MLRKVRRRFRGSVGREGDGEACKVWIELGCKREPGGPDEGLGQGSL